MSIEFSGGMTDDERIISTRQLSEDETENSLRPKSMADYIGQKKAVLRVVRRSKKREIWRLY